MGVQRYGVLVCMYVHMYGVYVFVFTCVWRYVCMESKYVCVYKFVCVVYMCVGMNVSVCVCACVMCLCGGLVSTSGIVYFVF